MRVLQWLHGLPQQPALGLKPLDWSDSSLGRGRAQAAELGHVAVLQLVFEELMVGESVEAKSKVAQMCFRNGLRGSVPACVYLASLRQSLGLQLDVAGTCRRAGICLFRPNLDVLQWAFGQLVEGEVGEEALSAWAARQAKWVGYEAEAPRKPEAFVEVALWLASLQQGGDGATWRVPTARLRELASGRRNRWSLPEAPLQAIWAPALATHEAAEAE